MTVADLAERPARLAPPSRPAEDAVPRIGGDGRLDALLESETAPLAVLDTAGRITRANRSFAALAGTACGALVGLAPETLFLAEDAGAVAADIAQALRGRAAVPAERRLRAAASDPDAAVEVQCRPLREEPGALLRLLDVTERRQLQSQLSAAARMQAVGQLAGGVAHDFNNLLATITAAAESAIARVPGTRAAEDLEQVLDSAARGARLVRQLLAFASAQPLQPRILDLGRAVSAARPLLERLVGGAVRVELAVDAGLPPVRLDPGQVDQILLNLAANAREAMPRGGVLRVALREERLARPVAGVTGPVPPGRWVLLEVADEGCGMTPDLLARVFEPFFTTRRGRGGTGLGLSTVLGAVRQSGGHLGVRSEPGRGTTFRIWLPPGEGAPIAAEAPPGDATAPVAVASRRVLLVEDEAPLRRLSRRALEAAGFVVDEAADAAGALAAASASAPDLLISDVMLGVEDGLSLARGLRTRHPGLPVVLISGYAAGMLGEDLATEGVTFLPKPFRMAELVAAAERALRH